MKQTRRQRDRRLASEVGCVHSIQNVFRHVEELPALRAPHWGDSGKPGAIHYMDSVREQAEVALAANFDPTLRTADLKIPTALYSGKDPFLSKLRAKIQKAEKIKLDARHLDRKADVLLGKTKEELVDKDLTDKTPTGILDRAFEIENGVAAIIDLTVDEIRAC